MDRISSTKTARRRSYRTGDQLTLRKRARDGSGRGGARPGSGPKPAKGLRPTPHRARPVHNPAHPVHVTLRVDKNIPSLRRDDMFALVRHSLAATNQSECPRLGDRTFRIVEFSVQTNHIHLIVEAAEKRSLSSGITSFATRAARAINKALHRRGERVWSQRAHTRALTSPRDVRNALVYVIMNAAKHATKTAGHARPPRTHMYSADPCSSAPYFNGFARANDDEARWLAATRAPSPVHAAQTWLLTTGWRRHGLVKRHAPFG
ncbi:MAG: transposase [Myxococcales bacterium]|nr:transposase [Myxococcales bacterium]